MLAEMNQTRPSSSKGALSSLRTPSVKRVPAWSSRGDAELPAETAPQRRCLGPGRAAGDLLEDPVAGAVAERLVDDLEAVDVEQDHGHLGRLAGGRRRHSGRRIHDQGIVDPAEEDLAGRQARHRVDRIVAGRLLELGVLEGDRGELGEPVEGVDLGLAPRSVGRPGGEADDADDLPPGAQRHPDDRADLGSVEDGRAAGEGPVVVDHDRAARPVDGPGEAVVDRHRVADVVREETQPGPDLEVAAVGLDEVASVRRRSRRLARMSGELSGLSRGRPSARAATTGHGPALRRAFAR
jgi:hypothetical protein